MAEAAKYTCVLIDDDDDDRLIFSTAIKKYFPKFQLKAFPSYEKGELEMKKMNQKDIFMVFLDLNMPKTNGLTALKEIRNAEAIADLPVVIYSTSNNPDDVNECLKAGATAFITKPSSIDELVHEIGVYLK